jgi:Uma2 family endonuclease
VEKEDNAVCLKEERERMSTAAPTPETLDDLLKVKEKAELIAGRIVYIMPNGDYPGTVAFEIAVRIREWVLQHGRGKAYSDNVGFALVAPLPSGRMSFSPDAAFHDGPSLTKNMRFVPGAPVFAVEVQSETDYGPRPEREMADNRADYFLAGTQVVWDVDPLAETIAVYRAASPSQPDIFRRGEVADAEPAVPGWRLKVDDIFT